ncbi:NADPH:quinone reductase-like Zn-dependent oxidoreductase [Pseudonocardia parietis]|uniref:NADPH:quinone reductase-like Zn-dependent oxidoreductase n=2 Tax=Pseudonocardia parietis TaxID=570936 RepID=A0ABS4VSG1_9PSEU|nr:NADPH:quinone reductase-like Zn-dependent oxidoreductase [Pseudonocardia parietis]
MSATMKAISQDERGGPEVLRLVEQQVPEPGPAEVLVRVHAAGVNPTDWKTRTRGYFYGDEKPPFTVGFDVAGTVEATGPGVTVHSPGDQVFGLPRFPHPAGAYAEYLTAPARHLVRVPQGMDLLHAAALPLSGLTAWQALVDTAQVRPGQRVLVHAAVGGVGHLAVQIAKAHGAVVVGTASAGKHDYLRELGVDEPVDYTAGPIDELVTNIDVVLDTLGGDTRERSLACLRPGGMLVSVIPPPGFDSTLLPRRDGVQVTWMLVEPDPVGLRSLVELVEAGSLRVHVDRTFPLKDAADAHRYGEKGRTVGKLVLTVS